MFWENLWTETRYPLKVFVYSRAIISAFVYYGQSIKPPGVLPGSWEGVASWLLNPWTYYDSKWYLQIASQGYTEQTSVFFPLYPMAIKVLGLLCLNQAVAGVFISNLTFLVALIVLQKLTRLDFPERVSRTTLWVVALWPTAAFFSAIYTESLFLLLLVSSFYMARKEKWLWCGVIGGLAAMTRNCGSLLLAVLVIEYLSAKGWKLNKIKKDIGWLSLILIGSAAHPIYLWLQYGDPVIFIKAQTYYFRPASPELARVWWGLSRDVLALFNTQPINISIAFHVLITMAAIFVIAAKFRKIRLSYSMFIVGLIFMNLTMARYSLPHSAGMIRYLSVAFPLAQVIAEMYEKYPRLKPVLIGECLVIVGVVSIIFGMKGFWG